MQTSRLSGFWSSRGQVQEQLMESAHDLIQASWRNSTEKQYSSAWQQWLEYCDRHGISGYSPALNDVLNYLANLYDQGFKYRTINVHRSALLSTLAPIEGHNADNHPMVCKLLKGVFLT